MKTYQNREAIIKDIDRAHLKIVRLEAKAQEELEAETLYIGTVEVAQRRIHQEAADKFLKAIKYQRERRLKRLGEKLAEMDTLPLSV